MLTIFRRHMKDCKFTGRKHRNCNCPIAVEGTLHGRMIRKSLDLRSWEAAQKLVRDWEANPEGGGITVKVAREKFITDAEARNLSENMVRKLRLVKSKLEEDFGAVGIRSMTVDDVRSVRDSWDVSPIAMQKRMEMFRSFFRFCVDSGWIDRNPAKGVRMPVVELIPTLPFTEEEMESIVWGCGLIRDKHPMMPKGIEKRLKALVLLMRYSGLRITDAVTLKKAISLPDKNKAAGMGSPASARPRCTRGNRRTGNAVLLLDGNIKAPARSDKMAGSASKAVFCRRGS